MRKLILMRHAKSSWDLPLSDKQRPLNERGLRNAPEMASRIIKSGIIPHKIYASDAVRSYTTAQLVANKLNDFFKHDPPITIEVVPEIYEASLLDLLHVLTKIPKEIELALVVGHNPTITMIASYLANENVGYFPTCAMACLQFEDDWECLSQKSAQLLWFDFPKNTHSPFF